jgi:hypothetical protein
MKMYSCFWLLIMIGWAMPVAWGQTSAPKQAISPDEARYLRAAIQQMARTDQQYRKYLAAQTLDDQCIAAMDSVYEAEGLSAYVAYRQSLHLALDSTVADSLWQLQHALDLRNHLLLQGILHTYGYLSKDLLGEQHHVPMIVLLHPPKDWAVPAYLDRYTEWLLGEVEAGRMPALTFATFHDNIRGKILRKPQLYGTNEQWDAAKGRAMPPLIEDVARTNQARAAIGLPLLEVGEYRLLGAGEK